MKPSQSGSTLYKEKENVPNSFLKQVAVMTTDFRNTLRFPEVIEVLFFFAISMCLIY